MKVISGGQTGVDTGAIKAAKALDVACEALFPADWKREESPPDWLKAVGRCLPEVPVKDAYSDRTIQVCKLADAILIVAPDLNTPGTQLTVKRAKWEGTPLWWWRPDSCDARSIVDWLQQIQGWHGQDLVLMVAGPRASKWPKGEEATADLISDILNG